MKKILLLACVATSVMLASNAEQLVKDNCVACHITTKPTQDQKGSMKAPPMMGVMFHLKEVLKEEQKVKDFIVDYVQNPTKEKAICMPKKIERFGLMPSLKGVLTKAELAEVADYLYANFPPKGFKHGKKGKEKSSPFLITGKMPHLTKMVKKNWDNPSLGLTQIQKEKLVQVRKSTMISVTKLKKEILPLEKEIAKATMAGETPKVLKVKVDKLATLKAAATMTHITCVHDTKNILDDKQLSFLLSTQKKMKKSKQNR
ncbi:MAG TPA: c-type cytochrome [Campylobacterales bacterium]|nr:c-type cytochrome [Campylobacterales bacterium]